MVHNSFPTPIECCCSTFDTFDTWLARQGFFPTTLCLGQDLNLHQCSSTNQGPSQGQPTNRSAATAVKRVLRELCHLPDKVWISIELCSLFRYWYKLASCCVELVPQSVKKYSWFEFCSERGKQFKETKEGEIICNKTRGPFILTTFWQPGTRQQQKQQHQLLLQK